MFLLDFLSPWVIHIILVVSVIGYLVAKFIPNIYAFAPYKYHIEMLSIAVFAIGIYLEGGVSNQDKWERKLAADKLSAAHKETKAAENTIKVITEYVDKIKIVKMKGDVIIKEIPTYITKYDSTCQLPNEVIQLHNAAALNKPELIINDKDITK